MDIALIIVLENTLDLSMDLAGKPLIDYIYSIRNKLDPASITVVNGEYKKDPLNCNIVKENVRLLNKEYLEPINLCNYINSYCVDTKILLINGIRPLINEKTLEYFVNNFYSKDKLSLISTSISEKECIYEGCDLVKEGGSLVEIKRAVQEKEKSKQVREINSEIYLTHSNVLKERLTYFANIDKSKYYNSNIPKRGDLIYCKYESEELKKISSYKDLKELSKYIWYKRALTLIEKGADIIDPYNIYIDEEVEIEKGVTLYPFVFLKGKTYIKGDSTIYSGVRIENSVIEVNCSILDNTYIQSSYVGGGSLIGPMAHLRVGTVLRGRNRIGNFVETKKVDIGEGSKASHLTYLGDAVVGKNVNIGCGVITCNYDGLNKNKTIIGDNCFIGSDVQFIAPVEIGDNVVVAAGSTINKNVSSGSLAISRTKQVNKEDYYNKWRERLNKR
ncbi:MAG: DapH/DapD/GlmU-related protein [Deferribacterota bacterium]|nr:DapH/DapD/GlmU-related protein [Deferribacterota bacterium]